MNRKAKICLIGATAVGKSSLVAQYVSSVFSDRYRTTIGVTIQTRVVRCGDGTMELVLWDLSGEDEFQTVQASYLRGASGYLLVVDGTRSETLDVAMTLAERVKSEVGGVACVVVLNKADLVASWQITEADMDALRRTGWPIVKASAKTAAGVEAAFAQLVDQIIGREPWS